MVDICGMIGICYHKFHTNRSTLVCFISALDTGTTPQQQDISASFFVVFTAHDLIHHISQSFHSLELFHNLLFHTSTSLHHRITKSGRYGIITGRPRISAAPIRLPSLPLFIIFTSHLDNLFFHI